MKRRIGTLLAITIPVVLVALFWQPVANAVTQGQEGPTVIASYRMQGNIDALNGATIDRVLWLQRGGNVTSTTIMDPDDLNTIIEFGEPTNPNTPNQFDLQVFYVNPNLPSVIGSLADSVSIEVVPLPPDPNAPSGIPDIDAGPDVTITEGDFAE